MFRVSNKIFGYLFPLVRTNIVKTKTTKLFQRPSGRERTIYF